MKSEIQLCEELSMDKRVLRGIRINSLSKTLWIKKWKPNFFTQRKANMLSGSKSRKKSAIRTDIDVGQGQGTLRVGDELAFFSDIG